MNKARNFH